VIVAGVGLLQLLSRYSEPYRRETWVWWSNIERFVGIFVERWNEVGPFGLSLGRERQKSVVGNLAALYQK